MIEEIGIIVVVAILLLCAYGVLRLTSPVLLKKEKVKEKPKPQSQPKTEPVVPNPCLLAGKGGYVGVLRREWKKLKEYPPGCYPSSQNPKGCEHFYECVGVEKKK